jgi:hypothetical protein
VGVLVAMYMHMAVLCTLREIFEYNLEYYARHYKYANNVVVRMLVVMPFMAVHTALIHFRKEVHYSK